MALFLTRPQLYRLIQRELPEFVYPDAGQPSAYWSTSDSDATAQVLSAPSGLYGAMRLAYDNQWPQLVDDQRIADWEIKVFGSVATSGASLPDRRAAVLQQLRTKHTLNAADIAGQVLEIIGTDKTIQLMPWGCGCSGGSSGLCVVGAWFIGVAQLGLNTYLGGYGQFVITGPDACDVDPAAFGISPADWLNVRANAYGYTVRIYGYTPTAQQLLDLDVLLTAVEPARSDHVIESGLSLDLLL